MARKVSALPSEKKNPVKMGGLGKSASDAHALPKPIESAPCRNSQKRYRGFSISHFIWQSVHPLPIGERKEPDHSRGDVLADYQLTIRMIAFDRAVVEFASRLSPRLSQAIGDFFAASQLLDFG